MLRSVWRGGDTCDTISAKVRRKLHVLRNIVSRGADRGNEISFGSYDAIPLFLSAPERASIFRFFFLRQSYVSRAPGSRESIYRARHERRSRSAFAETPNAGERTCPHGQTPENADSIMQISALSIYVCELQIKRERNSRKDRNNRRREAARSRPWTLRDLRCRNRRPRDSFDRTISRMGF